MTAPHADFIPHSRPTLGAEEARAAARVVASGQLAEGPQAAQLEAEAAAFLGRPHAIAVSSGTAALHLVLAAMGIGAGDEVIVPSFVCSALLNAVNYTGATAVPADIDAATLNLDAQDAARRLTRRTRAVILPHMFGLPADLDRFLELGVPIIEDCAQSIGSVHRLKPLGSRGRAAVFSFYATKVLSAGEGGLVATSDRLLAERVRDLKTYDRRDDYRVRFNYKLTDIQAAVARVQLGRLEGFLRRRREIADRFRSAFQSLPVRLPPACAGHIYFRFVVDMGTDSAPAIRRAAQHGIGCERPVHTPLHRLLRLPGFPQTEDAWRHCISIPIYPSLSQAETEKIIQVMGDILSGAACGGSPPPPAKTEN
jgi:dTDP-4-amino-4,6-dideoxygalactose transaminase